MKHIIISLTLMVACVSALAQTPSDLFTQFKGKNNAEYVHLGRLLVSILRPFACHNADDLEARTAMRCVRSLKILDLEDCEPEVKKQFAEAVNALRINGYHEVACSNSDGERTKVLIRQKGNTIRELLLLCAGDEDCSLVQIKCKVSPDALMTIVDVVKK